VGGESTIWPAASIGSVIDPVIALLACPGLDHRIATACSRPASCAAVTRLPVELGLIASLTEPGFDDAVATSELHLSQVQARLTGDRTIVARLDCAIVPAPVTVSEITVIAALADFALTIATLGDVEPREE